jgi:predicted restriction endonuclease
VFQRYGSKCAVCNLDVPQLLQAAHLVPVSDDGSFDPRNGLVLCYTHHRALDVGLFAFEPDTTSVVLKDVGPGARALGITVDSLAHLNKKPHVEALTWCWKRWSA